MRLKGFLFGADALIVLALISSLPLLATMRTPTGVLEKQAAGYAYLNASNSLGQEWLRDTWRQHSFTDCPGDAPFVAARNYSYPAYPNPPVPEYYNCSDASYTDYYEVCVS